MSLPLSFSSGSSTLTNQVSSLPEGRRYVGVEVRHVCIVTRARRGTGRGERGSGTHHTPNTTHDRQTDEEKRREEDSWMCVSCRQAKHADFPPYLPLSCVLVRVQNLTNVPTPVVLG